jgi:hypothetical protein
MTSSFRILSNSVFTNHLTNGRYIVQVLKASLNNPEIPTQIYSPSFIMLPLLPTFLPHFLCLPPFTLSPKTALCGARFSPGPMFPESFQFFSQRGLLFYPEDRSNMFLRKVGKHLPDYTASYFSSSILKLAYYLLP